ncbi:MAG: NACHT domain-containing protein, partial [Parachlamydiaceae bacterium]
MNSWHPQCDHSKKLYKQLYDFDQQSGSVKVDASGAHIESQGKQVIYISNTQMSTPLSLDERITLLQNIVDFNWNCVGCVLDIKQRAIYWLSASECNLTERAILYLVTAYKIQKKCGGPLNEITMLLADAFVQCQPARGNNLLHHFIEYRCAPVIKYLLKQQEIQSWLQQKNSEGRLPIHIAIMTGNSEIANLLLQLSSAELLNTQDNKGNTSLHLAVKQAIKSKADREKFESVIEGLLERDVDPNIKNSKGKHAFDLAFSCTEVKEIFLPFNRPILLKQSLSEYYAKKEDLSLLIPQQAQNIPIETIYTRLAIIGEREKKEKEKEIKEAAPGQSLTQLTYETIFEPKEAITLEKLFNLDPLKEASEKRVVIQGAPGIGKSTLCHHIAYQWAKKELFNEFDYLFWLPLRRLNTKIYPSGQDSLVNYLSKECDLDQTVVEDFLNNKNLRKKTLILLDGYDELSPEATNPEEGDLYKILEHLKKFPNVLMTSRPQAISDFKRVCDLEILGFDNRGIEEYIDRFFSTESTENRELRHYLKQHPLAKSLAHIPIHLEIFCSITTAGKLPSLTEAVTITGLYTILTEWLFRRFRCERGERKEKPHSLLKNNPILAPEVRYKKKALEEIAWKGMKSDKRSIDHSSIEKTLKRINKKRSLKKELSTEDLENIGLIKPENDHVWVFNHSTFQEYFAASKLACLYLKEDTRKATFILKKIKLRPQYQLVLSMTAGLLSKEKKQNGLLLFFNDLYSEPRDLAESYESDLMATCFAECETLESLSERYDEFMCQTIANLESPIYDVKNSA